MLSALVRMAFFFLLLGVTIGLYLALPVMTALISARQRG